MAETVSHDQNFKNLILDYPRPFWRGASPSRSPAEGSPLEFFAADEAAAPEDDVRIVPVRQEQLQQRLGRRYRELDVPLRVEWVDGRREAVLFALEEESDGRRFSPHRLAHYCLDLAELFNTDRVVPVSIFLRGARAPARLVLGTERHPYLTFDYLACRLDEMDATRWLDSDNPVARVNLPNMRSPDSRRVEVYAQAVRGLLTLEPDVDKRAKYLEFIDIYAALTDNEFRRYRRHYPEDSTTMAGFFQRARDEGRDEGMREGRNEGVREGRLEGERAVLTRLLQRRFGLLAPTVTDRLHGASSADLEAWAENVLDARTLDDVFEPRA